MQIGLIMGALGEPGLNTQLFDGARRYIGEGASVEHVRIADLPAFVPAGDVPDEVVRLHEHLARLDGLLILATQHLNGVTGAIKNALDWMAHPSSALERKPVAVAGLTHTPQGTFAALQQVRSALMPLGALVMRQPEYTLDVAHNFFGDGGVIEDVVLANELASFLTAARGFVAHELRASEVDASPYATGTAPSMGTPTLGVTEAIARLGATGAAFGATDVTGSGAGGALTAGTPLVDFGLDKPGMIANPRRYRAS